MTDKPVALYCNDVASPGAIQILLFHISTTNHCTPPSPPPILPQVEEDLRKYQELLRNDPFASPEDSPSTGWSQSITRK